MALKQRPINIAQQIYSGGVLTIPQMRYFFYCEGL